MKFLLAVLSPFVARHRNRRLIEFDGSRLLQLHGPRAVARALELNANGIESLSDGRRKGHWRRVARCIAARPIPVREHPIFG